MTLASRRTEFESISSVDGRIGSQRVDLSDIHQEPCSPEWRVGDGTFILHNVVLLAGFNPFRVSAVQNDSSMLVTFCLASMYIHF